MRHKLEVYFPVALLTLWMLNFPVYAHNVTEGDAGYIQEIWGVHLIPFMYLGSKHMVTGYDHILFLLGVVFFLYKMKEVTVYVSIFAFGHSTTMLLGCCMDGVLMPISSIQSSVSPSYTNHWTTSGHIKDGLGFNPIPNLPL
jgi:hydrogenase/urease accessory protein HupE